MRNKKLIRAIAITLAVLLVGGVVVSALVSALAESGSTFTSEPREDAQKGIFRMDGQSMEDTLADRDYLQVDREAYQDAPVQRGDIVVCHFPNRYTTVFGVLKSWTNFVKRVVALPGDGVYRKNGVTHVVYEENGQSVDEALDEEVGKYYPNGSGDDFESCVLGEDEYFVVGDNRHNSHDSRDWKDSDSANDVGPIALDMIVGRVEAVVWPQENARDLD